MTTSTNAQSATIEEASATIRDWVTVSKFRKRFPNIPEETLECQLGWRFDTDLWSFIQVIQGELYKYSRICPLAKQGRFS